MKQRKYYTFPEHKIQENKIKCIGFGSQTISRLRKNRGTGLGISEALSFSENRELNVIFFFE